MTIGAKHPFRKLIAQLPKLRELRDGELSLVTGGSGDVQVSYDSANSPMPAPSALDAWEAGYQAGSSDSYSTPDPYAGADGGWDGGDGGDSGY